MNTATPERASLSPFTPGELATPAVDSPEYRVLAYIASARTLNTKRARAADLGDVAKVLGFEGMGDYFTLTPEAVAHYRDTLSRAGKSAATIARRLATLRGLYGYAMKRGWADSNPADPALVPTPKVPKVSTTNGLDADEARALLGAIDGDTLIGKRDRALLLLGLELGLRRETLAALDVVRPADWNARTAGGYFEREGAYRVLTTRGKGGTIQRAALTPRVERAIGDYLTADGRSWDDAGPMFRPTCNARGGGDCDKALTPNALAVIVGKRAKAAGIGKRLSPHSLRHAAATGKAERGVPLHKVSAMLGHADVRTTQRYLSARENLRDGAGLAEWF